MSRCKDCGAEIEWQSMKSGKMMPVDPEPVFVAAGGNQVFITDEGEDGASSLSACSTRVTPLVVM